MRSIRPITWYLPKPDFLQNNEGKRKYDRTPRCHFPFWGSQSSLWKAGAWGMRILQSSFAHERVRCCSLALKVKPQCLSRLREDFSWVHSCQHFRPQWRDQSTYTATSTQQLISWQWDMNSEVHWSKIRKKRSRTWYTRSDLEGRMNKWLVACTRDTVRSHTDDGLLFGNSCKILPSHPSNYWPKQTLHFCFTHGGQGQRRTEALLKSPSAFMANLVTFLHHVLKLAEFSCTPCFPSPVWQPTWDRERSLEPSSLTHGFHLQKLAVEVSWTWNLHGGNPHALEFKWPFPTFPWD